jgi:hypothetical protein
LSQCEHVGDEKTRDLEWSKATYRGGSLVRRRKRGRDSLTAYAKGGGSGDRAAVCTTDLERAREEPNRPVYLPAQVGYFTDIFTTETWAAAGERDYAVSGFPAPTATRGGYFQSTFDAVKVGDLLACYVKAPAKRWVGALRVEGEMYVDESDAVWGYDEAGRVRFPARFHTSPILTLPVEEGLPVHETVGVLRCMNEKTWSGLFRRSLTRMPREVATSC